MRQHPLTSELSSAYRDMAVWSKLMFPHYFFRPFSEMHSQMFRLLDDDSKKLVAISAPRGIGKTSCVGMSFLSREVMFRNVDYAIVVSSTASHSQDLTEDVKEEWMNSERIPYIFRPLKSSTFSKEQWIVEFAGRDGMPEFRAKVLPRGAGQQIRGKKFGRSRPKLIIVDDLEDDEDVRNEDIRAKLKEWFFSALLNTVDRGSDDWRIIVIGTVLHEDSLLLNLLEDPAWCSIRLDICDDEYNSLYPEFISTAEVHQIKEMYERQGLLDKFMREYRGLPIAQEKVPFRKEDMIPYDEPAELWAAKTSGRLKGATIVDPAKTVNMDSAETGITVWGIDTLSRKMYLRDAVGKRMYVDEVVDKTLELVTRYDTQLLAIETTSLEEWILNPFRQEIARRHMRCQLVPLKARGKKEDRVGKLSWYYREGLIRHNKMSEGVRSLEAQLLSFPRPKRWDLADSGAYIVRLLEEYNQIFSPDGWFDQNQSYSKNKMIHEKNALRELYRGKLPPSLSGRRRRLVCP